MRLNELFGENRSAKGTARALSLAPLHHLGLYNPWYNPCVIPVDLLPPLQTALAHHSLSRRDFCETIAYQLDGRICEDFCEGEKGVNQEENVPSFLKHR